MSKIKLLLALLPVLLLTGCMSVQEAYRYTPSLSKSGTYLYGRWVVVNYTAAVDSAYIYTKSGELIAHKDSQMYVLDQVKMDVIPDSLITTATLFMYKKNPKAVVITTLVMIIPNFIGALAYPGYAAEFLALAVIPVINGIIFTSIEGGVPNNQLRYPKNDLEEFTNFARFPQGIPEGLDVETLELPLASKK